MKKIDLGQTIGILANVGVIAGIVFLGAELRQNNELMGAEARNARNERVIEIPLMVSANADLADVLTKAKNGETLSEAERLRVYSFYARRFRGLEAYFGEFRAGIVESIPVENWRLNFHSDPWTERSLAEAWSSYKAYLGEDFVLWMDENIANE